MVWFVCDDCGDTIKKPKVPQHLSQCSGSRFTCLDCSRSFDRHTVKGHATCVTEVDKYAKGATKPGGYAAQGYYKDSSGATVAVVAQPLSNASEPADAEFLSTRPPWTCSVCNVTCTSQDTLQGHAAGVKHRRRARAAAKGQKGNGAAVETAVAGTQVAPIIVAVHSKRHATEAEPAAADGSSRKVKKFKLSQGSGTAAAPAMIAEGSTEAADAAVTGQDDTTPATGPDSEKKQSLDKIKWKKLATLILKQSQGPVKLSKLQKQLRLAAQVHDNFAADANAAIESRLKGSSQFEVKGKSVMLATTA